MMKTLVKENDKKSVSEPAEQATNEENTEKELD